MLFAAVGLEQLPTIRKKDLRDSRKDTDREAVMDLGLKDKVAFVCGCTAETGKEICSGLVQEGAKIFMTDIVDEKGQQVASELASKGGDVWFSKMDVCDYQEVATTVQAVQDHFGRVDILIYVAGFAIPGKFAQSVPENWKKQIDVCLYGFLNMTHTVLQGMIANNYGRIVSLMGDSSRIGEANISIVAAARAGQIALIKSVAKEVGRFNVTLNGVSLGVVDTPHYPPGFVEKNYQKLVAQYPLGRLGKPEDIAPMVLLLSSDRCAWTTGQIVSVNGGFAMV
jgi:NAD(P)-dependent dehydrogenase (short-subunit alcohol dehydrogenase family)